MQLFIRNGSVDDIVIGPLLVSLTSFKSSTIHSIHANFSFRFLLQKKRDGELCKWS